MPERRCPKCESIYYSSANNNWRCPNILSDGGECGMILTSEHNLNRPQKYTSPLNHMNGCRGVAM